MKHHFFALAILTSLCQTGGMAQDTGELWPNTSVSFKGTVESTIDKTRRAGTFDVSKNANQYGALTYDIPITVQPGLDGFQPELSLAYNSLAGNTEVGIGWSINGISYISRECLNDYYDGQTRGIRNDISDAFTLDGIRLVQTGSDSRGVIYKTETGNIVLVGHISGNNINYFDAYYPDGRHAVFGDVNHDTNMMYYPITTISDLYNNTIDYAYFWEGLHYAPRSIEYNGCSVEFVYTSSRHDPQLRYKGGEGNYETRLLSEIKILYEGVERNSYKLKYNTSNIFSALSSVEYYGGMDSYNPIRLYYGESTTPAASSYDATTFRVRGWCSADDSIQNGLVAIAGRFDYVKGNDGLVTYKPKNPYVEDYRKAGLSNHSVKRYVNAYNDDDKIWIHHALSPASTPRMTSITVSKGFVQALCADLEGNGEEKIIRVNNYVNDSNSDMLEFTIYSNLNKSPYNTNHVYFDMGSCMVDADGNKSVHPRYFHVGDFDGDGKQEMMAVSINKPLPDEGRGTTLTIFDLEHSGKVFSGSTFDYNVVMSGTLNSNAQKAENESDKLFVFDLDGDGKSDICHITPNGTAFYTFEKSADGLTPVKVVEHSTLTTESCRDRQMLIGEMNADGLVDIILTPRTNSGSSDGIWHVFYSKGNGDFEKRSFQGPVPSFESGCGCLLADVDFDGKSDLISYTSTSFSTHLNRGNVFNKTADDITAKTGDTYLGTATISSRNSYPRLITLSANEIILYSFSRNVTLENKLTAMVSPTGIVDENEYKFIEREEDGFFHPYSGTKYPYADLCERLPILSSTSTTYRGEVYEKQSLEYEGGTTHLTGLGFLGFQKVTSTDKEGRKTETRHNASLRGVPVYQSTPTESLFMTYSSGRNPDGTLKLNLTKRTTTHNLDGYEDRISYTYDEYGNPESETTVYTDGSQVVKTYTYLNNDNVGDGYFIGLPTEVSETVSTNDFTPSANSTTRSEWRTYSNGILVEKSTGYRLSKVTKKVLETKTVDRTSDGLHISVSETNVNDGSRSFAYIERDSHGRNVLECDIYGNTDRSNYDRYGQRTETTDPYGAKTTYVYDIWGDVVSSTDPDGATTFYSTYWADGNDHALYYTSTRTSEGATARKGYDAFGNVVCDEHTNIEGDTIRTIRYYDTDNRMVAESLPFIGSMKHLNTFDYDFYGRLTTETHASGKIVNHGHNGLTTTTTKNGTSASVTKNCLGQIVKASDQTGEITFKLTGDGRLLSATTPDGGATYYDYDSFRRLTSVVDPSRDATSYTYYSDGCVKSVTDAEGRSVSYTYDSYGRVTSKRTTEKSTTYKYNLRGELVSELTNFGVGKEYKYDSRGRIAETLYKGLRNEWLKMEDSYSNGRLDKRAYSSRFGQLCTENRTYKNGGLYQIHLNDTISIFCHISSNHFDMPTLVSTGNIMRSYEYSDFGSPLRRMYKKALVEQPVNPIVPVWPSASVSSEAETSALGLGDWELPTSFDIQGHVYKFDDAKELMTAHRYYGNALRWEQYAYDSLERLCKFDDNSMEYDRKGNITARSDVGAFSYDNPDKPYALTAADFSAAVSPKCQEQQIIEYYDGNKPAYIEQGDYVAFFDYDGNDMRCAMELYHQNDFQFTKHYLADCYELVDDGTEVVERLYLGGDYYKAFAVLESRGDSTSINYLLRDALGSITAVTNQSGDILEATNYDPWGNVTSVGNKSVKKGGEYELKFGRGFTGHEHLPWFGLINMNSRLYDPVVGRFLSPDPRLQQPNNSQNYNRYSYALNNPLKYTDPQGEFFLSPLVAFGQLIANICLHGLNVSTYHWRNTVNALRIDMGMFKGNFTQILGKWTWGLANSVIGATVAQAYNSINKIGSVTEMEGMLALSGGTGSDSKKAFTIGHLSIGPDGYTATWKDHLFVHEYGHYIQSQIFGPLYLPVVGLPSLCSAANSDNGEHKYKWFERSASRLGGLYFDRKYGRGKQGYVDNSEDYFDYANYTGRRNKGSAYTNPRTNSKNSSNDSHPISEPPHKYFL